LEKSKARWRDNLISTVNDTAAMTRHYTMTATTMVREKGDGHWAEEQRLSNGACTGDIMGAKLYLVLHT
jgi:hypothetical protein